LSPAESNPPVHVVAAALIDAAGRVLIAQRPAGKHLAGGWEFPGGKLEPGEERRTGLSRELQEELGVAILAPRPLMRLRHSYPSGEVLLDIWVVREFSGEPRGLDGQTLRWCTATELEGVELLPADKPIVAALRLPERLTHTSTPEYLIGAASASLSNRQLRGVLCATLAEASAAAATCADFLVMRGQFPACDIIALCELVSLPVYVQGTSLEEAWALGATGTNEIS
jgi:8-oxo-dGTP diphosphatase